MLINKFWQTYLALHGSKQVWIAYSGGLDSRVLLELAVRTLADHDLQAIHVNHNLLPASSNWVEHCRQTCASLQIPLHVAEVTIDVNSGASVEALARAARRKVWEQLLPSGASLLLAHHQDDQTETVLQRLFRGAGPTGLSGMATRSKFGNGWLLRPLLQVSKQEINNFAREQNLQWITDPSNQNVKFDRNFIRHELLPLIAQRWPAVSQNIVRSAELCREEAALLADNNALPLAALAGSTANSLAVPKLLQLSLTRYCAMLRAWLRSHNLPVPSRAHLQRIHREILQAAPGSKAGIKYGDYQIYRCKYDLCLRRIN